MARRIKSSLYDGILKDAELIISDAVETTCFVKNVINQSKILLRIGRFKIIIKLYTSSQQLLWEKY